MSPVVQSSTLHEKYRLPQNAINFAVQSVNAIVEGVLSATNNVLTYDDPFSGLQTDRGVTNHWTGLRRNKAAVCFAEGGFAFSVICCKGATSVIVVACSGGDSLSRGVRTASLLLKLRNCG